MHECKKISIEIIFVIFALILTYTFNAFVLGVSTIGEATFDIPIHDTYIVIASFDLFVIVSLTLSTWIVFLRKVFFYKKNSYTSFSVLLHLILFVVAIFHYGSIVTMISTSMGADVSGLRMFFMVLELFFILLILLAGFRFYKELVNK